MSSWTVEVVAEARANWRTGLSSCGLRSRASLNRSKSRLARSRRRAVGEPYRGQAMGNAAVGAKGRRASPVHRGVGPARRHRAGVPKDDAKDASANDRIGVEACAAPSAVSGAVRFGEIADAWKQDAKFRAEYQRIGPAMELAFALSEARREAHLTQAEVSRRMGTSQAPIARLEGGSVKRPGKRSNATPARSDGAPS